MGIKFSYVLPSDFGENVFYFTNSHVGIQPYFTNHGRCLWSLDPASKKHDQSLDGSLHGKSSQTTKLVAKSDQNHQKGWLKAQQNKGIWYTIYQLVIRISQASTEAPKLSPSEKCCGRGNMRKNIVHRLQSCFPSVPDRSIATATNQLEKTFQSLKSIFFVRAPPWCVR